MSLQQFQKKIDRKEITGHVGLDVSIAMIADALAWKLDKITIQKAQPIIAKKNLPTKKNSSENW